MERNNKLGWVIFWLVLGLIAGGILGESFGFLFGKLGVMSGGSFDNPIRNFFVKSFDLDLGFGQNGWALDLYMVKLRIGLAFKFNVCSLLGAGISFYIMKWWKN